MTTRRGKRHRLLVKYEKAHKKGRKTANQLGIHRPSRWTKIKNPLYLLDFQTLLERERRWLNAGR